MNKFLLILLAFFLSGCGGIQILTPTPAVNPAPVSTQDSQSFQPPNVLTAEPMCSAVVIAEVALNLRVRPSESDQALYPELAPGSILTILADGYGADGKWMAVMDGSGRLGWVNSSYVRKDCR